MDSIRKSCPGRIGFADYYEKNDRNPRDHYSFVSKRILNAHSSIKLYDPIA